MHFMCVLKIKFKCFYVRDYSKLERLKKLKKQCPDITQGYTMR